MSSRVLYLKRLQLYSQKDQVRSLLETETNDPNKRFEDLLDQSVLIWHNHKLEPKAILSFTQKNLIPEFSFIPPNLFITDIITSKSDRNLKIGHELIQHMLLHTPMKEFYHFLTARTLSDNERMVKLLEQGGFSVINQQLINREHNIKSLYYSRRIPSPVVIRKTPIRL